LWYRSQGPKFGEQNIFHKNRYFTQRDFLKAVATQAIFAKIFTKIAKTSLV